LNEKIRPYLLPLFDALRYFLGQARAEHYSERNVIEIAPLAYMRGRTLDNSFMILDEAQNTTPQQMKMFLTRIGKESRAVITGDVSQIDLDHGTMSGMVHATKILKNVKGVAQAKLEAEDIVRHPVVAAIVKAYDNQNENS
jgi:phosphate starvation-inducible PhoH-like protein